MSTGSLQTDSVRLRNAVPWLLILLVLGTLGLFAWMTLHPQAPWIERAEDWPVVGPWAERFRQTYVPPEPQPASNPKEEPDEAGPVIVEIEPAPPRSRPPEVKALAPVWLEPGMTLHMRPSGSSPKLTEIRRYQRTVPLSVRGPWHQVEIDGWRGWVHVDRPRPRPGEPLLGRDPAPVLPVEARPPDEEKLARARALLQDPSTWELGPYELHTDVRDALLLDLLDQTATALEVVYRERFDLEPVGRPAEAIVLFSKESGYRRYQAQEGRLRGLPAAGHAGSGLVALFVGEQEPAQVAATLIHELTHLLNRRSLGPALPPWLDEGLAEDLTWSRLDAFGRPLPGTWGGVVRETEEVIVRWGGSAVRDRYRRAVARAELIPLDELFRMEWRDFVSLRDGLAYVQAGLWVRWLLDREPRERFHRFLEHTSRGEPITEERLLETIGLSWEEMEAGVKEWVMGAEEEG